MIQRNPLRYFGTSPEVIRLAVMMHIRFPNSAGKKTGASVARNLPDGRPSFITRVQGVEAASVLPTFHDAAWVIGGWAVAQRRHLGVTEAGRPFAKGNFGRDDD